MILTVTDKHLAEGNPGSPDCCPVALAFADAFDVGFNRIRVDYDEIKLYEWPRLKVGRTPRDLAAYMKRIDAGEKVEPAMFEV